MFAKNRHTRSRSEMMALFNARKWKTDFMLINGLRAKTIPNDFNRMRIPIGIVKQFAMEKDTLYLA